MTRLETSRVDRAAHQSVLALFVLKHNWISARSTSPSKGSPVNLMRVFLAACGAFVAYFALGGLLFGLLPMMKKEFMKYPAVYRSQEGIKKTMPFGMVAMFFAILALAVIYALLYQGGSGLVEGARFGALIGVFSVGSFVIHNHVNLNIGAKLTLQQSVAYFAEWLAVGVVIGLIYSPLARP